jgi:hypothetical protein
MAYANILVRNENPKDKFDSVPLNSKFSFDLVPYNGDIIDIDTLTINVEVKSQNTQKYTFTNTSTENITLTGSETVGYKVVIDISPSFDIKFNEKSQIEIKIEVSNSLAVAMKRVTFTYRTLRLDQMEALMDLLSEMTEVCVYQEQGRILDEGNEVSFTWDNWSAIEDPVIYKNDIIVSTGFTIDKTNGKLIFSTPLKYTDPTDRIEADYKHGVFTQEQLVNFMKIGLSVYNSYPRASNYSIQGAPVSAQAAIILGGAYYAICSILAGLINQQSRVRWGDEQGWEKAQQIMQTLKENYKGSLDKIYEMKKMKLAQPMAIVLPEYSLPGGRSRFFRYLYKEGGSM